MPEHEDCDHDHGLNPETEDLMMLMVTGLTTLDGEDLMFFFRQMISEMFIRTHPDDDFLEMFALVADDVLTMFNPETTPQPDMLEEYTRARDEFVADVEAETKEPAVTDLDTALEASAGLADLFSEHGVLEEDAVYGNYL